ncbi:MAG: hypothetical protein F6K18_18820 [Okeania sp. SIO2C2]|uniref:hypothetical protein n=1 Tax=unclassified Okeania TaxID=2634635 RepID=UPI0013B9A9E8|nr:MULTISPECIES: hypothetical protein [unclassified Okeania]NEP88723.1 hypothetical protein [Okeania sp. SIO2C2]NEQ77428.1 hypothetical protein [Okeania sp. SIO2C9]
MILLLPCIREKRSPIYSSGHYSIVRISGNYDDSLREQDARTNCQTPTWRLL